MPFSKENFRIEHDIIDENKDISNKVLEVENAFSEIQKSMGAILTIYNEKKLVKGNENDIFDSFVRNTSIIRDGLNYYEQEKKIVNEKNYYENARNVCNNIINIITLWKDSRNAEGNYELSEPDFKTLDNLVRILIRYK